VEDNLYNKLKRLSVQAGNKDKILSAHVQCICEVHDTVMQSYYQQIHGLSGADVMAKAAAPERTLEKINFVVGRRGTAVEDNLYNKLKRLSVQAGNKDKILSAHVQCTCEVHDTVMQSYYQQIHGSSGADAMASMENSVEQVSVRITHNLFVIN